MAVFARLDSISVTPSSSTPAPAVCPFDPSAEPRASIKVILARRDTIAVTTPATERTTALPTMTNKQLTASLLHFSNTLANKLKACMLGSQPPPPLPSPSPVPPLQLEDELPVQVGCRRSAAVRLQAATRGLLVRRRALKVFVAVRLQAARGLLVRQGLQEMRVCEVSAAVLLQAVARGLLVRRWLQEMRARKMCRQTLEAAVAAVVLGIRGRDLALWNGGRRAVSTREQGSFLASGGLLVVGEGAQPCATAFRYRPPRGRLRGSLRRAALGGHPGAPLSSRWRPWDPGGYTYAGPTRGGRPSYLRK